MTGGLSARMLMKHKDAQGLGGARRRLSWRQFILALGLHIDEEMQAAEFGAYWAETPSYTVIWDPILRMCHRLIACSIAKRSKAPKKVTVTDLFYLRGMDVGSGLTVISPELLVIDMDELVRLHICVEIDDTWAWADLTPIQAPPPPPPAAANTIPQRMARLDEDVHEIRRELTEQYEVIDAMARDFSKFYTWTTTSLARMMNKT
ncbi:hypothetical protein Tco_1364335, partial [Tanacetum coccineum]